MIWRLFRWIFFCFSPETAHRIACFFLRFQNLASPRTPSLFRKRAYGNFFGQALHSPLGLAAGFDKNGEFVPAMTSWGFGFVEVGTVTPRPQEGNPKPRLFRLPYSRGLVNCLGFNNKGMARVVRHLERSQRQRGKLCPIGINIGKNKDTPLEQAHLDYEELVEGLYSYADFFVVNISSPNTPGLRDLQEEQFLQPLLRAIRSKLDWCGKRGNKDTPPLLLKIAPDLQEKHLYALVDTAMAEGFSGVVATNTTVRRDLPGIDIRDTYARKSGGLSGAPLRELSLSYIPKLRQQLGKKPLLISVGGLCSREDARQRLDLGANLLELYTGLVYEGPGLVKEVGLA